MDSMLDRISNPIFLVIIVLPLGTIIFSFLAQLALGKKLFVMGFVFAVFLVATFTVFNRSFLIWCFIYAFLALISTFLADFSRFAWRRIIDSRREAHESREKRLLP